MTLDVFTRWWVFTGVWAGASNSTGTQIFHNNTIFKKNSVKATNAGISFVAHN
jgi:hypothetical protein